MLQELESFLLALDGTKFSIPELNLLKQRYSGACSWASHVNDVLGKLFKRSDYDNIVNELTSHLEDGKSLGVKGMLSKYTCSWCLLYSKLFCCKYSMFTRGIVLLSWRTANCWERTKEVLLQEASIWGMFLDRITESLRVRTLVMWSGYLVELWQTPTYCAIKPKIDSCRIWIM